MVGVINPNPAVLCARAAVNTFQRHPLLVKVVTSGIGFAVGDGITQVVTRRPHEEYNWQRTTYMGAAGAAVAGPVGFLFLVWMNGAILPHAPSSRLCIATKIALDQIVGAALWQAAFLCVHEPYRRAAIDFLEKKMK